MKQGLLENVDIKLNPMVNLKVNVDACILRIHIYRHMLDLLLANVHMLGKRPLVMQLQHKKSNDTAAVRWFRQEFPSTS